MQSPLLRIFAFALFSLSVLISRAQGLQDVIVETYYISDADDAVPNDGGVLNEGSVTYRIYIDMAPGYELQAVYGNAAHELRIETTTQFFNNEDRGEQLGSSIGQNFIDDNTVAVDSWLAMSGATTARLGILKANDPNGSMVGGANNNDGLLANNDPGAGIPLTVADGLMIGTPPMVTVVGLDLSMFDAVNSSVPFASTNGAWSVLAGVMGPTADNRVLIAQITTDGDLHFTLNVQLGTPGGGTEQFVASNPTGAEIQFDALTFPLADSGEGCTNALACNYDPDATADDGSCIVPQADCVQCNENNTGLEIVDGDGDGVCDAEEISGCTNPVACNYLPAATDDSGNCIVPVPNCQACNANNDGLVLVDTDGDGVCDAQENPGCTNPAACNYDPAATGDDGSCLVPSPFCTACNGTNDGLELIDSDGDGICNAQEIFGCTSETACNYDPGATEENGDCILPVAGCFVCNEGGDGLIIVDLDGDGVCDAEEITGCTSQTACNYSAVATDDDGTCIEPVLNCFVCNENNDGLIIVDADNDGICDAQENPGCTSSTACNYDETALNDDGSCIEPVEDCLACNSDNTALELVDEDGDGICDAEEIPGCTDPEALNYNPEATDDDGSCEYFKGEGCDASGGLEDVVVEVYYVCDEQDTQDEDGITELAENSVTYRVWVDLADGYELQAVFGNASHELRLETTTYFYNQGDRGEATGDAIPGDRFDENTLALDSYVSMGAGSDEHLAVPKTIDEDGSIVGGANNDGGSEGVAGGLLVNQFCPDLIAPFLTESDGLEAGVVSTITAVGIDLNVFGSENVGGLFTTNNGAWSVLEGVQGANSENKVLIAQLTTDGLLTFRLNLQLGGPGGEVVQYVASNPASDQIQCDKLTYGEVFGCTNSASTNYNPLATIDDCSCTTSVEELEVDIIQAFPNPADERVSIALPESFGENVSFMVWNSLGQLVQVSPSTTIRNGLFSSDVSGWSAGLYTFRFASGNAAGIVRVIVE